MLLGTAHPGIEANKDDRHVPRSQDAPVHGGSAVAPHVHNDSDIQGNGEVIDLSDDSLPDVPEPHGDLDVLCAIDEPCHSFGNRQEAQKMHPHGPDVGLESLKHAQFRCGGHNSWGGKLY